MADAVTATTVEDGPKKAVFYLTNTSDGTACTGVRIEKIVFTNVGMGVQILWNASTNVIAAQLPADYSDTLDYSDLSGLPNVAASGGNTGDIKLTTIGHSNGDTYSIVLHCIKQY